MPAFSSLSINWFHFPCGHSSTKLEEAKGLTEIRQSKLQNVSGYNAALGEASQSGPSSRLVIQSFPGWLVSIDPKAELVYLHNVSNQGLMDGRVESRLASCWIPIRHKSWRNEILLLRSCPLDTSTLPDSSTASQGTDSEEHGAGYQLLLVGWVFGIDGNPLEISSFSSWTGPHLHLHCPSGTWTRRGGWRWRRQTAVFCKPKPGCQWR